MTFRRIPHSEMISMANRRKISLQSFINGMNGKKTKQRNSGERMNEAICLQPQPLQIVTNEQVESREDCFFADNLTYVEFLITEAQLWLALAYLRLKHISQWDTAKDIIFLKIPYEIKTKQGLIECVDDLTKRRKVMEANSVNKGISLKFREIAEEYGLDDFSMKVLQLVLVADASIEFMEILEACDIELWNKSVGTDLEIGLIFSVLCKDYREQMDCRGTFAINRPLLKYELIKLSGYHVTFLQKDVELHERICRFCLDDHNVYETDLLCIDSEWPTIKLSQVVLAEETKSDLIRYTESFLANNQSGKGLSSFFGYGAGLTCLFYGLSGTGKTMLAHGLANHLGCQLLSLNIGGLGHAEISFEDAMQHIFREAKLVGGIVFLDECDDLLTDNSHMSRSFLIEIEKAECITILATNKTVKMDPALDRRISLKIPFTLPYEKERLAIWEALLPEGICYGNDVDLEMLASKYHFTGGLIKNTLLMAVGNVLVASDAEKGLISLSVEEIHKAARHQAKSMFDLGAVGKLSAPGVRLEDLNIRRVDLEKLEAVAQMVPEIQQAKEGFCGLISSENKRTGIDCVEAIAAESGLMVRQFNISQLFSKTILEEEKPLDPFTQQKISLLEYVFMARPGQQEIVVLVDDAHIFEGFLEMETSKKADAFANWQRFKELMRTFRGILFVVSNVIAEHVVPIEFAYYFSLSYPTEGTQIRTWQHHFPEMSNSDIVTLVEQFPMYVQEIDLVAKQVLLMIRLHGFSQVGIDDISGMAKRLRGIRTTPFLFGNQ